MKNIFKIFFRDLKRIAKNPIAIITMIGVCFIPALYAWFNIVANWDPYGNTNGIKVAVANVDLGYQSSTFNINVGDEIINNLKSNNQIGWQFVDKDQVINGVKSGEYYAGVIVPENFSQDLTSILNGDIKTPKFNYYINQKKNAIAPKITDKGVGVIQQELNKTFVKTISEVVDKFLKITYERLNNKERDIFNEIKSALTDTNKSLDQYKITVDSFTNSLDAVKSMIDTTKLVLPIATGATENGANIANDVNALLHSTNSVFEGLDTLLSNTMRNTDSTLQDILVGWENIKDITTNIKNFTFDELDLINREIDLINKRLTEFYNTNEKIADTLRRINNALPIKLSGLETMASKLANLNRNYIEAKNVGQNIKQLLNTGGQLSDQLKSDFDTQIKNINKNFFDLRDTYDIVVKPQIDSLAEKNYKMLNNIYLLMKNTQSGIYQITEILDSSYKSLESTGKALQETKKLLDVTQGDINNFKSDISKIQNDIKSDKLATILSNDPELMATFLSAPVGIETFSFYEIENYGSAMSPFYSTLALWVGGIILVSLLKVKVDEDEKIKNIKHYQSYLGRYLLFMCLGLIQSLIICLGDLYFLKIQCLNPALFVLSGMVTSFIFTNIIYTLTVSFGDIGKALCVFLLVIQIAGSGGTFPIEVTPEFFQNVYPMLPFTYAINSMREAIAGVFENNFYENIINLLCFLPLSLTLGILLRVPLIKLNEFFEERLEETHLI